jgi:hypothetical protein
MRNGFFFDNSPFNLKYGILFAMKNVTDALLYPYSRAYDHFAQVPAANWNGRIVHVIVGLLECIPVVNYAIVPIDLFLSRIFAAIHTYKAKWSLDLSVKLDQFSQGLNALIPAIDAEPAEKFDQMTEWLDKQLGEMQEWNDEQTNPSWDMKLRRLRDMRASIHGEIQKLKPLTPSYNFTVWEDSLPAITGHEGGHSLCVLLRTSIGIMKGFDQQRQAILRNAAKLPQLQDLFQQIRDRVAALPQDYDFAQWQEAMNRVPTTENAQELARGLKDLIATLQTLDLSRQAVLEEKLRTELVAIPPVQIFTSMDDYLRFLGVTEAVRENGKVFLPELGIYRENVGLYGLQTMEDLACLNINRFQEAILQLKKATICRRYGCEEFYSQVLQSCQGVPENDALDKARQLKELKSYLSQQYLHKAWTVNLPAKGVTTLSQFCARADLVQSFFDLGINYGS